MNLVQLSLKGGKHLKTTKEKSFSWQNTWVRPIICIFNVSILLSLIMMWYVGNYRPIVLIAFLRNVFTHLLWKKFLFRKICEELLACSLSAPTTSNHIIFKIFQETLNCDEISPEYPENISRERTQRYTKIFYFISNIRHCAIFRKTVILIILHLITVSRYSCQRDSQVWLCWFHNQI